MLNRNIALLSLCLAIFIILNLSACSSDIEEDMSAWKDLLKISQKENNEDKIENANNQEEVINEKEPKPLLKENIDVDLYFQSTQNGKLTAERRSIEKEEGIGRKTLNELFKGPQTSENQAVAPKGTSLLDINVKEDGTCVVDLSSEARNLQGKEEEEIMIYAIANTLGQFTSVKRVEFMINGEKVDYIGYMNIKDGIEADYTR